MALSIMLISGIAVYFSVKWMLYFSLENHKQSVRAWGLDVSVVLFFSLQLLFHVGVPDDIPTSASVVGAVLFVGGVILASYSRILLSENYRAAIVMEAPSRLVTRGPFVIVRNPIYAGTLLAGCGVEIALFSPFFFFNIITALVFAWQVRKEEKVLQNALPQEWAAFCKQTPYRLLPFVY